MIRRNQPCRARPQVQRWWELRASQVSGTDADDLSQPWKKKTKNKKRNTLRYPTPKSLWDACCEYFEWVENTPLEKAEMVAYKGNANVVSIPKMRAMTSAGLQLFLGINDQTWWAYRDRRGEEYRQVCLAAERVIWIQKFTGAAAELLNSAIIARDLGLKDTHEVSGPGGRPIQVENRMQLQLNLSSLSDDELTILEKVVSRSHNSEKVISYEPVAVEYDGE